MNATANNLCIKAVVDHVGPVSPLMRVVISAMCKMGFPATVIATFIYELLHGKDDDGSGGGKAQIFRAIGEAMRNLDLAAFTDALEQLHQHQLQASLWETIENWVFKKWGDSDYARLLIDALRAKRPPFATLDEAIAWAENWTLKNPPPAGPANSPKTKRLR
jgi:hypothetical protein